jgi:hypothetical protein
MATYTGAEQVLVDLWVKAQLDARAAEFNAVAAGLSTRIFLDYAPEGTPYPFVIYQCQSPPRDVRGVGLSRVLIDTLYVVKAVSQVDSYAPLAPIAKVIDAAMTSAAGSAVEDGLVLTSVRQDQFSMVERDQGTQFRHFGGEYKIQAQAGQ